MLSMEDLLKGSKFEDQSIEIQDSLMDLLTKANKIEAICPIAFIVTSGFRTMEDHIRIYKEKAAKAGVPFDLSKVPMHSKHLEGKAVDITDPNREIQQWCTANEKALADIGVWMESFDYTSSPSPWCHFQTSAPKSGHRWFLP
jgi:acetyl esterase/lipase